MKIAKPLQGFYRWVKTWVKSESVSENVGEKYRPKGLCLRRQKFRGNVHKAILQIKDRPSGWSFNKIGVVSVQSCSLAGMSPG